MIIAFGILALSLTLLLWQWLVAVRFPLHRRATHISFAPAITILKPLKGADETTKATLQSWFTQKYSGEVQILFGVAAENDPACEIIRALIGEFPDRDAQLLICPESLGANAKVSKLIQLLRTAKHEVIIVSDADVRVPEDFLANIVAPLKESGADSPLPADGAHGMARPTIGLVNCFYRFANPATLAMQWEATATNADFWSQVLQSRSLKPMDFALGAVMLTRQKHICEIGGFEAIVNCLADDYQLGNRIAEKGYRVELSPVAVECWETPKGWPTIWKHQLRWARTIRACQPLPYFFSILNNVTLWALVASLVTRHSSLGLTLPASAIAIRILATIDLQRRLEGNWSRATYFWLAPVKDLLQTAIWLLSFTGNTIEWRGEKYSLQRDGTLRPRT